VTFTVSNLGFGVTDTMPAETSKFVELKAAIPLVVYVARV